MPHFSANLFGIGQLAPLRFVPAFLDLGGNLRAVGSQPVFFGNEEFKRSLDDFLRLGISAASKLLLDDRLDFGLEVYCHSFTLREIPKTGKRTPCFRLF